MHSNWWQRWVRFHCNEQLFLSVTDATSVKWKRLILFWWTKSLYVYVEHSRCGANEETYRILSLIVGDSGEFDWIYILFILKYITFYEMYSIIRWCRSVYCMVRGERLCVLCCPVYSRFSNTVSTRRVRILLSNEEIIFKSAGKDFLIIDQKESFRWNSRISSYFAS